jgi:fluoride exporter
VTARGAEGNAVTRPNDLSPLSPTIQIAVGGAAGTALRLALGGALVLTASSPGPWRLLAVNALGSFLLGALAGGSMAKRSERWMPLLSTGLLGGLTTFSALIVQAGGLGHRAGLLVTGSSRMTGTGVLLVMGYLLLSILLGLGAFRVGGALGRRTSP